MEHSTWLLLRAPLERVACTQQCGEGLLCCDKLLDMTPVLRLMRGVPQVVGPLQIEPQLWCGVEGLSQSQGHIWRHSSLLMHDLRKALPRDAQRECCLGDANMKRFQIVPLEYPPGCVGGRVRSRML